jgi:hypothetical protein
MYEMYNITTIKCLKCEALEKVLEESIEKNSFSENKTVRSKYVPPPTHFSLLISCDLQSCAKKGTPDPDFFLYKN